MNKSHFFFACLFSLSGCMGVFYQPSKQQVMTPKEIGITYQDVWIKDEGEPTLHAWYLPAENPIATVLHLHGNAENISTHFASVYWMPAKGLSVLTLDYRGYGLSEGQPSIEGIHKDILRAAKYLNEKYASSKVVLFGQSLGATMALYSAAQKDLHGKFKLVVAESPFAGYRSIIEEKLSLTWLTYPFKYFLPYLFEDSYSPLAHLKNIAPTPILLIHGTEDPVVNFENSELICRTLGEACQFWRIEGGGHISAFQSEKVRADLLKLLKGRPFANK